MERLDCVVIGAGVIGLAVARALAMDGREVVVLESETAIGTQTSSRNSEVIHAAIYYRAGSLKARLCREGRDRLYAFCEEHGVPHQRLGKIVVATSADQHPKLEGIAAAAAANGVDDLRWLDRAALRQLEPELNGSAALLSPSTGIIDSHAFMASLEAQAQAHGALVVLRTRVWRVEPRADWLAIWCDGDEEPALLARTVVNAAGLGAPALSATHMPPTRFAKGSYFTLAGGAPFKRLVYPAPEAGGLGVHMTLDMAGQARFGPDVEWVDKIDYSVDPTRAERFYDAVRLYWPGLEAHRLTPGYSGVRPRLHGVEDREADFVIETASAQGMPRLVNLLGIESPGLTASLAIAGEVRKRVAQS